MREVVTLDIGGAVLRGTHHRRTDQDGPPSEQRSRARIGFLFLNTGHAARAGHGNLLARIGDELAHLGHPVFRFDLSGTGDSPGELPKREDTFWRYLQTGGYTETIRQLLAQLAERFALTGMVVGGICGGAVASLLASDRAATGVVGLVLLDPVFTLSGRVRGRADNVTILATTAFYGARARLRQRILRPGSWLRALTGRSAYRQHLLAVNTLLHRVRDRVTGRDLPSDTNLPLVEAWTRTLSSHVPVLVITARESPSEASYLDITLHVAGRVRPAHVIERSIANANHTFTTPGTPELVIREITDWARAHGRNHQSNPSSQRVCA